MTAEQALGLGEACTDGPLALVRRLTEPFTPADCGVAKTAPPAAAQSDPRAEEDRQLAALLRRIARHDESALAQLYDATLGKVYGLTLRIAGRPDAAEEIAADTYMQVWRDAGRYQPERGRVLAWLLTIARSRAIDAIRRRDEALSYPDPERLQTADAIAVDDPQDLLLQVERDSALHRALAELSALQRQLLALAFFRGLTHEEICVHTRLPLGSVKTHIRKAMALLRERLVHGPAGEA
jgi:RNA polymerase sigma-70 factor (ECF subfamily)